VSKLSARINPEAYAENSEEIFKCLSEGYMLSIDPGS